MTGTTIRLPFPPSANNLFAGQRRRYPAPRYRTWRRRADLAVMSQRPVKHSGAVRIGLVLHQADKRARDADNYVKPILDCLVRMGVIARDDHGTVKSIAVAWGEMRDEPAALVTITAA